LIAVGAVVASPVVVDVDIAVGTAVVGVGIVGIVAVVED